MDSSPVNPYEAPQTVTDSSESNRLALRSPRSGPALYIVLGAFVGGLAGAPLLAYENTLGFLTAIPGALAGGLAFRACSRNWPIDPTVKRRRYGYAMLMTVLFPAFFLLTVGLRGQGMGMTLLGLMIGLALGLGILVSGDRRWRPPD